MINRKRSGLFLISFVVCSFISCATARFGGLDPKEAIPLLPGVRAGTLSNGLQYYIVENKNPADRAWLTLAVNAGAVLEEDDEDGYAHFVEHLAFQDTEHFNHMELVEYLRSLGMRFGADVNASTGSDETIYEIEVPVEKDASGIKQIPEEALRIIDDWTQAVQFNSETVDKERLIILEERRMRFLSASGRLREMFRPLLYAGSKYALRNVIGQPDTIEHATAAELEAFYQKWYKPENMALIFAGDFDGAALEENLEKFFTAPASPASFVHPENPLPGPEKGKLRVEIFTDPELTYTTIQFFYKQPHTVPEKTIASFREDIIDNLIEIMISERFRDARMKKETPFVSAGAGFYPLSRTDESYCLLAAAKTGRAEETINALLGFKESLIRYGFTGAEIERAKKSFLSFMEAEYAEKDKQDSPALIGGLTAYYLSNDVFAGIDWELAVSQQLLPRIAKSDINTAVKNYFSFDDALIFVSAPQAEAPSIPSSQAITGMVRSAHTLTVAKPSESAVDSELLDAAPEAGDIIDEDVDEDTEIIYWELSNGA